MKNKYVQLWFIIYCVSLVNNCHQPFKNSPITDFTSNSELGKGWISSPSRFLCCNQDSRLEGPPEAWLLGCLTNLTRPKEVHSSEVVTPLACLDSSLLAPPGHWCSHRSEGWSSLILFLLPLVVAMVSAVAPELLPWLFLFQHQATKPSEGLQHGTQGLSKNLWATNYNPRMLCVRVPLLRDSAAWC